MARVVLKFGGKTLKDMTVDTGEVSIGRNPENYIHIDNLAVSGFHAKILREGDTFFIEDLGSLNGTFLGGKKVTKAELHHDDRITIGKHTLIFLNPEEEPAGKPVASLVEKTMILDTVKHREMAGKLPRMETPPEGKVGVLKVVGGSAEEGEYELAGSFATIGKGKAADIRIKGFFAPEIAALLQRSGEKYYVSPPEKGRKPKVNGMPVDERTELKEGDTLEAGGVRMVFYIREIEEGDAAHS